jgi:hypothetical protein
MTQYEQFIVGRQFISIIAVVSLVFLVSSMNQNPETVAATIASIGYLPPEWSAGIVRFLNHDAAIFIISTLLPCWLCQLLPHFMVESNGLGFLTFPFSNSFAAVSLEISKLEAGAPAFWVLKRIRDRGHFVHVERISAGDEAIYNTAAAYQGYSITKREITIKAEESSTIIDDCCTYEFRSGSTQNLQHLVKVTMAPEVRLIGWSYQYPEGLRRAKEVQAAFSMSISSADGVPISSGRRTDTSPANEAFHAAAIENGQRAGLPESTIVEEYLFLTTIPLHVPLPQKAGIPDSIEISVSYQIDPLDLANYAEDTLFFEIGKPTGILTINMKQAPGTFIRPPKVGLQPAEELPYFGQPRPVDESRAPRQKTSDGWKIQMAYPPVGARVVLSVDALPDAGT